MLTGIYGEPLELVKTWLLSLSAFGTFSPSAAVYLYQRIGSDIPPEEGDAWAVLRYRTDGHSVIVVPTLDVSRTVELTLVRVVGAITQSAVEGIVNDAGTIVEELKAAAEAAGILTAIKLHDFAIDETTDPPTIGAIFYLPLDIGGR